MKELTQIEELDAVLTESASAPILLFKHSTTCPVSAGAHRRVADYLVNDANAPTTYLVKVIESRPLSNEIASRLQVTHQSPQAILVAGGEAVWNASHGAIDGDAIRAALDAS